jgi:hypothetical protein
MPGSPAMIRASSLQESLDESSSWPRPGTGWFRCACSKRCGVFSFSNSRQCTGVDPTDYLIEENKTNNCESVRVRLTKMGTSNTRAELLGVGLAWTD